MLKFYQVSLSTKGDRNKRLESLFFIFLFFEKLLKILLPIKGKRGIWNRDIGKFLFPFFRDNWRVEENPAFYDFQKRWWKKMHCKKLSILIFIANIFILQEEALRKHYENINRLRIIFTLEFINNSLLRNHWYTHNVINERKREKEREREVKWFIIVVFEQNKWIRVVYILKRKPGVACVRSVGFTGKKSRNRQGMCKSNKYYV